MWWVYKNYHDERNGTSLTFSYLWFYTMVLHNDSTLYPGPGKGRAVAESGAVSSEFSEAELRGKWAFGLPIASIPLSQNSISTQTNRCPREEPEHPGHREHDTTEPYPGAAQDDEGANGKKYGRCSLMCQNLACAILRLKTRWHTVTRCTTLSFCVKVD